MPSTVHLGPILPTTIVTEDPTNNGPSSVHRRSRHPGRGMIYWTGRDPGRGRKSWPERIAFHWSRRRQRRSNNDDTGVRGHDGSPRGSLKTFCGGGTRGGWRSHGGNQNQLPVLTVWSWSPFYILLFLYLVSSGCD